MADTREAATSDEESPAEGLGTTQRNTYTTWSGTGTTEAAALLADTGGDRVFLWNGARWLRYAEVGGRPIPGSLNYLIQVHDVLRLGSDN